MASVNSSRYKSGLEDYDVLSGLALSPVEISLSPEGNENGDAPDIATLAQSVDAIHDFGDVRRVIGEGASIYGVQSPISRGD